MNFLISLSPAQWDWIDATARALNTDPVLVVFRLLEIGQPILEQQIRLKPRKRAQLRVVKP